MTEAPKRPGRKPKDQPEADPAEVAPVSRPGLTEHELTGLFAEAFEAYDYQDERIRFDSKNRRWLFVPEKVNSQSVLLLQLKRLEDVREDTISTAFLASELGRDMIADVVRKLDLSL